MSGPVYFGFLLGFAEAVNLANYIDNPDPAHLLLLVLGTILTVRLARGYRWRQAR